MGSEELDPTKLEQEVAKVMGEEETPSESTSEETPAEEKTEETPSEETPSEDTTSLKSEEETAEEEKEEEEKEKDRFDKHPRFQELRQKLADAEEKIKAGVGFQEVVGDLSLEELKRLRTAGDLLRKYPQLAEKVRKVIDEHNYGNEETKSEIDSTRKQVQYLEDRIFIRDCNSRISGLMAEHEISKEDQPLLKELIENRLAPIIADRNVNLDAVLEKVPEVFELSLKAINSFSRRKLASHVVSKKSEKKVPASTTKKGKVIAQKSEAADISSVVDELAEGLKTHRGEPAKE